MAKSNKEPVVIRAKIESATPDRTQWKPYSTTLTFDEVYVDIPVPADQVIEEKGGKIVLTVDGVAVMLDVYLTAIDKMNEQYTLSKQNPYQNRKPYQP
jgi:hypothetical protein